MADSKISALTAITTLTPATDVLPVVDVTGTTKKITTNQILGSGGTATLASATITGDLTVRTNGLILNSTGLGLGVTPVTAVSFPIGTTKIVGQSAVSSHAAGNVGTLKFGIADGGGDYSGLHVVNSHNGTYSSQDLLFFTGEGGVSVCTERMRLTRSGNLGLGVTPSAWTANRKAFELGGTYGAVSGNLAMEIYSNAYYNGTNFIYRNSSVPAALIDFNGAASGGWAWRIAGNGTAGNAITFVQAMTLDASGRLVIGNTTARSTADVYGTLTVGSNTAPNFDFKRDVAISGADSGIGSLNYGARYDGSSYGVGALITGQSGGAWTSTSTPGYLSFRTTPSSATTPVEGMRLDSSGNLLVGTTSSVAGRATFVGPSNAYGVAHFQSSTVADTSNPGIMVQKYANDTTTSQILQRFLVNNGATSQGQINANGASQAAFGSYSDSRLKDNIVSLPSQLANIVSLRPVEFDYKDGSGHQIGFVAQEMQEVYSDAVGEQNGFLTVTGWSKTEARLVSAIKELAAKVQSLEAKLA